MQCNLFRGGTTMFRPVFVVWNLACRSTVKFIVPNLISNRRLFQYSSSSPKFYGSTCTYRDVISSGMPYRSLHGTPFQHPVKNPMMADFKEEEVGYHDKYPLFNSINYDEIAGGDEELLHRMENAVSQMRCMARKQHNLPSQLKQQEWHELLKLKSFSGRLKYLNFLFRNEMKRKNAKIRKEKLRIIREELSAQKPPFHEECGVLKYGLAQNSLFLRIYDTTIDKIANFATLQSIMFGPKIIVDCSYNEYMVPQEVKSCAKQILFLFGSNRVKPNPLDIHFVNFKPESELAHHLLKYLPTMYEPHFPFNWTSKSYLDLYPTEKLVYLTPHCEESLLTISHDDVYIVGAMVDRSLSEPLSLTKAIKSGIRYAKLPLSEYVDWKHGTKSLTVDQCLNIVADTLQHGSWEKSLKAWIPPRKLQKTTIALVESGVKQKYSTHHLKNSQRRNIKLYEFLQTELEGGRGKKFKGQWPL